MSTLEEGYKKFEAEFLNNVERYGICAAYGKAFYREEWGERLGQLIPDYMISGLVEYIIFGTEPGGFLSAVLSNDLMGALRQADSTNLELLPDYGTFLHNYAPIGSFGSQKAFDHWVKIGGASHRRMIIEGSDQ